MTVRWEALSIYRIVRVMVSNVSEHIGLPVGREAKLITIQKYQRDGKKCRCTYRSASTMGGSVN